MSYHEHLSSTLRVAYERFLQDQEVLDLSKEMALLKAHLAEVMENPPEKGSLAAVRDTIAEIRKMSGTVAKNMEHARGYIPISFLPVMTSQIAAIIDREVKDPDVVRRIRQALGRVSIPANSREARRVERLVAGELPAAGTDA